MTGERKPAATPSRRPVKKRPARAGARRPAQPGRRAPSMSRAGSAQKRSDRKKGFFSSLSCCSSKKKPARKPVQKQPMPGPAVKKQPSRTRPVSKQQQPKSKSSKSKERTKSKSREKSRSREKVDAGVKEEHKKVAAPSPKPPKRTSKEALEDKKKADLQQEKDCIATALPIEDESNSEEHKKRGGVWPANAGPEQSLLVKKFVRDGRNVLRWEYEESVPAYSSESYGIPKLLEDKPKRIANFEQTADSSRHSLEMRLSKEMNGIRENQESQKKQDASPPEPKNPMCCLCCNCEGNKKLRS